MAITPYLRELVFELERIETVSAAFVQARWGERSAKRLATIRALATSRRKIEVFGSVAADANPARGDGRGPIEHDSGLPQVASVFSIARPMLTCCRR